MVKKVSILFVSVFLVLKVFAQTKTPTAADTAKNSLQKAIDSFVADVDLKNAAISFKAVETKNNKTIAELNPNMSLVPASTMKVITTASALEILGGGYRFKTTLQYTGYIDTVKRVLMGNIIIKGGGDPGLGSKFFNDKNEALNFMQQWADTIRKMGIDSIAGRVIADAEIYGWDMAPSTWSLGDVGNGYGAAPCGLSVYDNVCVLKFRSGKNAGDSAYIECINPYIPELEFYNEVYAGNTTEDNAYIMGVPYANKRFIRGTIPKGRDEFEVKSSLPDPAYLVAFELEHTLHSMGIKIAKPCTTVRTMKLNGVHAKEEAKKDFYVHYSPYLSSIVYWTNLVSVNLFAEHLCNQIGVVKYGNGTTGSGVAAITDFWKSKGIDVSGLYITDGSGLSRYNGVASAHLVDILNYMANRSKNYIAFESSLPVAGKSGTLSGLCKGTKAQNNLMAKSGTMTRVKSYAGYVKTKNGKKLTFAIIVNNYNCNTRQIEKKIEKLMVAMAEFAE